MPQLLICGEQTVRTETASGGRLHFGTAAGIKSEWWPGSNRNGGRDQIGIPGRIESEFAVSRMECIGSRGGSVFCGEVNLPGLSEGFNS